MIRERDTLQEDIHRAGELVEQAKRYLERAEERLTKAREAFLEHALGNTAAEAPPEQQVGFRPAPLAIQYCVVCRDTLGSEHNPRDTACLEYEPESTRAPCCEPCRYQEFKQPHDTRDFRCRDHGRP